MSETTIIHVLVESTGLIPEPTLFRTADALRAHVVARLVEEGPEGFVWRTVEGAGADPNGARADELAELASTDPKACAEALVDSYLGRSGGCIFNDSGDEFRWFEETFNEAGGGA